MRKWLKPKSGAEAKLTSGRVVIGSVSALGALGCGYIAWKGYGPSLVETGAGIFLAGTSWEAFNVQRGNMDNASNSVEKTRKGTRLVSIFGVLLAAITPVNALFDDSGKNTPLAFGTTTTAEVNNPTITTTENPTSNLPAIEGTHCAITAPFPNGPLTEKQFNDAKMLQAYTSGLELPDHKVLSVIAPDDNNFKSKDSQLAKNITAIQIANHLDPKMQWNDLTCKVTPFWQP